MENSRNRFFSQNTTEPSRQAAFSARATQTKTDSGVRMADTAFAVSVFTFLYLLLLPGATVFALLYALLGVRVIFPVLVTIGAIAVMYRTLRLCGTARTQRKTHFVSAFGIG